MPEAARGPRERSGCALTLGVLLIAFGSLFLAVNLGVLDWSALSVARRAVVLYADYWPLILVVWGGFKVFRHFTAPSRARVGFFEVVFLLFVIGCGLTLRTARRVMNEVGADSSFGHVFDFVELEILGAPAHRFTEETSYELDAVTTSLVVENAGGAVSITGADVERLDVVLEKRVQHLSESEALRLAEEVSLDFSPGAVREATPSGTERVRLAVRAPDDRRRIAADLTLVVPRRLAVTVQNQKGPVSVRNLSGFVDVETADDDVEVRDLEAGVRAKTRHGRARIENVSGRVEIRNQRGAIDVRRVHGELIAETSHRRMVVADVDGSATLRNVHSSIRVERVSGNVDVGGEHADVSAEAVGGTLTARTSYEPVFARDVEGAVTIETSHAAIQVLSVRGDVDVSGLHTPVTLARVGGAARVTGRPSVVTVDDVSGALTVEGADEKVSVSNFRSSLEVRSTHAELFAATNELAGNVVLETTYEDVELRLPRSASARIVARTRDGELRSELSELRFEEQTSSGERRWDATLGSASHTVEISTRHGDIQLRERP